MSHEAPSVSWRAVPPSAGSVQIFPRMETAIVDPSGENAGSRAPMSHGDVRLRLQRPGSGRGTRCDREPGNGRGEPAPPPHCNSPFSSMYTRRMARSFWLSRNDHSSTSPNVIASAASSALSPSP